MIRLSFRLKSEEVEKRRRQLRNCKFSWINIYSVRCIIKKDFAVIWTVKPTAPRYLSSISGGEKEKERREKSRQCYDIGKFLLG